MSSLGSSRRPSALVLDEHPNPLTSKGHGALTNLIRTRSNTSLSSPLWKRRFDEEESVGTPKYHEEWSNFRARHPGFDEDAYSDPHHRTAAETQRLNDILHGPHMRSMRLIGKPSLRYQWAKYWKTEEQLEAIKSKKVRAYYERCNYLIQQYAYIDKLLDSSLPHDLVNEYNALPPSAFRRGVEVPYTISEELSTPSSDHPGSSAASVNGMGSGSGSGSASISGYGAVGKKVKRTPKSIYRPTEMRAYDDTPLLAAVDAPANGHADDAEDAEDEIVIPDFEDEGVDSDAPIVSLAIYVNFAANMILLIGKLIVVLSVPSVSVLASLVDAALDWLSTVIVWISTTLVKRRDPHGYPIGRRQLEPLSVVIFSVVMITSFVQVGLEAVSRLLSGDHTVVELTIPAIGIMASTILIKGLCWFWCRLIKNSSVQALAEDAMTDIIFNAGSIAFPIVGYFAQIWWLDALGGLLLSLVVVSNWSENAAVHIKNLSGAGATADQRNVLLYLTMRFAKTIRQIQGLQAYHAGDKLNVEVDIVLDASTSLKDTHDIAESLQYVLESVPNVDRAFVHVDYASYNLPTHMDQQFHN